ncbi:MAG: DUF3179 domain-containing protein [bacterium]
MFQKRLYSIVFLSLFAVMLSLVSGCSSSDSVTGASGGTNNPPTSRTGFGVSGLLFENNLLMWFRETDGQRSELFPQMYLTRTDAANFPVWNDFPTQHLVSGGVPRDGIPALVNPAFAAPGSRDLNYLRDNDLVLGVVVNGEAKAYPENILWWHEIANDRIGGVEIVASLCPLTGTGIVFRMPENGNTIDKLEMLPVVETTWKKWREMHPNTTAISENTGFSRDYTAYPYGGYRSENTQPLFPLQTTSVDTRFPQKHTVLGLLINDVQMAYPFSKLQSRPVVNDDLSGKNILIVSEISSRLAIPYDRNVSGQTLTFTIKTANPFEMTDDQTGSIWNIQGEAISGTLAGSRLEQIPAYNAFWFAWSTFWPNTQVF